ncbi:hypothetical protein C1752_13118 [Acaryochloris thomasi RCC1774]|uniref:Uncharacterized protein n=1 Tax=Acaryochloris thomasi RCC1774 TaxID=1764569 RepID=A0A2W1JGT8_9CYAN|nr:hypothetical protein [Acaryochloris thomasi]PZD70392.1 hypothetical protein C1752_13118 [Acaryochloris thomasi RCC1774]
MTDSEDDHDLLDQLARLSDVEKLTLEVGNQSIFLVKIKNTSTSRQGWEFLQQYLTDQEAVEPIMIDEAGHNLIPTGAISVRFTNVSTETEIEKFSCQFNLILEKVNQYIPQQLIFRPLKLSEIFLPDLIQSISKIKGVEAAWANAYARYQRI